MTRIEEQLAVLRAKYPALATRQLSSGAVLVEIPSISLPVGWSEPEVKVLFLIPPGYPAAQPDCFWVDRILRLADKITIPQNTNDTNPIPDVGSPGTWFSWHLQSWNPNQSTLSTYVNVIRQRLDPAR